MDETQRDEKMKTGDVDWSEMCSDAMQLILESLSIPDFHRASTVCSKWYSVSKSCVAGSQNRYPWLILFPEKSSDSKPSKKLFTKLSDTNSCRLCDPRDGKIYRTRYLGDKLSEWRCLASYGNWLLMLTPHIDFYVINVFTGERINLPSLSLRRKVSFERKDDGGFFLERFDRETIIDWFIETAVLWIDEKTKDFVVCWIYNDQYLFSFKKGDDSWWHLEDTKCLAMAYKDQKLCVYTSDHHIKILDYSGDIPEEIIKENPYLNHQFYYDPQPWEYIWKRILAITTSGDILIILSLKKTLENEEKRLFYIFKMNLQGDKWERVDSLGNEMLVFGDHGYTLAVASSAKEDNSGGVIYFVADDVWPPHTNKLLESSTGAFDLATTEIRWSLHYFYFSNIRWFVPGSDKQ